MWEPSAGAEAGRAALCLEDMREHLRTPVDVAAHVCPYLCVHISRLEQGRTLNFMGCLSFGQKMIIEDSNQLLGLLSCRRTAGSASLPFAGR